MSNTKTTKTSSSTAKSATKPAPKSASASNPKAAMDRFKTEVASELGVNLKDGYNGDLSAKDAGSVGGEMVRRMVKSYEQNLK